MSVLLIALAIVIPSAAVAAVFFVTASRREGLDRRKNQVGGTVMLLCGAIAGGIAAFISTFEPRV